MPKDIIKQIVRVALVMIPVCLLMVGVFYLLNISQLIDVKMGPVWIGALIGYLTAVGNFLLLAITVTYASKQSAAKARAVTSFSYTSRLVMLAIIIILSVLAPFINFVAVVIPLVIPQIILTVAGTVLKKKESASGPVEPKEEAPQEWPDDDEEIDDSEFAAGTYIEDDNDEDDIIDDILFYGLEDDDDDDEIRQYADVDDDDDDDDDDNDDDDDDLYDFDEIDDDGVV